MGVYTRWYTLACFFQRVVQRVRFRRVAEGGSEDEEMLDVIGMDIVSNLEDDENEENSDLDDFDENCDDDDDDDDIFDDFPLPGDDSSEDDVSDIFTTTKSGRVVNNWKSSMYR